MLDSLNTLLPSPEQKSDVLKNGLDKHIKCALVGSIVSYDAATQTASVQPTIREKMSDGSYAALPILLDVPVFFAGGAYFALTWPVKAGDECLVVFADSCIDAWYQSGGVQNPMSLRMHDLSDGFAFVGFRSKPNALPASDSACVKVKTDSGWLNALEVTQDGDVKVKGQTLHDYIVSVTQEGGAV